MNGWIVIVMYMLVKLPRCIFVIIIFSKESELERERIIYVAVQLLPSVHAVLCSYLTLQNFIKSHFLTKVNLGSSNNQTTKFVLLRYLELTVYFYLLNVSGI